MRSGWRLGVALTLLLSATGCTSGQPDADLPTAPTTSTSASVAVTPVVIEPEVPAIEAALPKSAELGRFDEYSSCFARDQVCSTSAGARDRQLSWVRGSSGMGGSQSSAMAEVMSTRRPAQTNLRRVLIDVRRDCPPEFVVPFEPRGFFPHPELDGVSRLEPVELAGFRGSSCAQSTVTPGFEKSWCRLVVARGDLRLSVSAGTERLAFRLFREYVARLG
jgi:hypothetical protein